ncbi:GntR family transcriptional regulator [Bordetella tumulicola]|uniref:GntR family transcriptional regulator n=1 Tax=Bordetella tumulicola TaxID=1649133 RepID=UPI0039EE7CA8
MTIRIVRQALYLEVADRLRGMIRSQALASGEWIDEVRLTRELGISRTPLREALKVLATEGLVRLEPRRGCFVNELSLQDLEDIFPLMAMLEGRCAYEATLKATGSELADLDGLHQALQAHASAGQIDAYYDTNAQIHEAVQALANNRWLSDMVGNLRKVLGLFRHKSLVVPGRIHESCAEHMAIFAALKARDPDAAEALARKHLLRQLDALRLLARQAEAATAAANPVDPLSSPSMSATQETTHARPRLQPARSRRSAA